MRPRATLCQEREQVEKRANRARNSTRAGRGLAALALALLLASATAASAHHGVPAEGGRGPGEQLDMDTEITPVAKPGEQAGWEQIGGSKWSPDGTITNLVSDSPTSYDLDFFGVDFLDKTNGFAVGAQCRRTDPIQPVPAEQVAGCERIPVIYRFRDDFERGLIWEESYRGSDASDPGGFIAGVSWLGPGRALAVGGTGTYPRREAERKPGESDADYWRRDEQEGAGMARAWLFESGAWRELRNFPDGTAGDEIPDAMRALNALDASPRPADCGPAVAGECAAAGGLAQLWQFTDGAFERTSVTFPGTLRFRVRDLRFAPPVPGKEAPNQLHGVAVTSGCCAEGQTLPVRLTLDQGGWHAASGGDSGQFNPDSYYSALISWRPFWNGYNAAISAIRTAGGPPQRYAPREPPSRFTDATTYGSFACDDEACARDRTTITSNPSYSYRVPAEGTTLSTLRLLSADGDATAGPCRVNNLCSDSFEAAPDGIADWAVGALRSSGRGVAYTTLEGVYRINPPGSGSGTYLADPTLCEGDDSISGLCTPEGYRKLNASRSLFALDSYALNAFRTYDDQDHGFAVGDHGAIVRLGAGTPAGAGGGEAPGLGPRKPHQLAAGGAYEAVRPPVTNEPGLVPALAAQPTEQLAEPRFVSYGTPNGHPDNQALRIAAIVISRDGSEGWALAAGAQGSTFIHFDGRRWRSCDGDAPGLERLAPDPACASLVAQGLARVTIADAARIPLERDSDPTNDDQFEVIAVGDDLVLRYSGGRWERDPAGEKQLRKGVEVKPPVDVAFTAPDDGWLVKAPNSVGQRAAVFHFDGERWIDCDSEPVACGDDPNARRLRIIFPHPNLGGGEIRLAEAGERVYLFATRESRDNNTSEPYPVILYHDRGGTWRGGEDTTGDGVYNPTDGGWDPGRYFTASKGERIVEPPVNQSIPFTGVSTDTAASAIDSAVKGGGGSESAAYQGRMRSLSVAQEPDGSFRGWAVGVFGGAGASDAEAVLLRLEGGRWRKWTADDAAADYLRQGSVNATGPRLQLTLPSATGTRNAFIFGGFLHTEPALAFSQRHRRWEALPTPWLSGRVEGFAQAVGQVRSAAPDGQGGLWVAVQQGTSCCTNSLSFHRLTERPNEPVFEEAASPTGAPRISAVSGGVDGSFWLGDEEGTVYRYDRVTGWDRAGVPGWDLPRSTTKSPIAAIAVGPDGRGVAVGPQGRIANVGPDQLELDATAGVACDARGGPCATRRDLRAAAVAPDGSALVAGAARTVLWRPPGSEFRPTAPPPVSAGTTFTQAQMPRPDRAYLVNSDGRVLAGDLSAGGWSWRVELGEDDEGPRAGAIAIDGAGHGYAVGGGGLLERTGDGAQPWRRLSSGYLDNFHSLALPAAGVGEGLLIGAENGLILTLHGEQLEVAKPADPYEPVNPQVGGSSAVSGLALIPGTQPGQVEAWAVVQANDSFGFNSRPGPQTLLHYASDPTEPLLNPDARAAPLPDAPAPRAGEISFAAFGKQDCLSIRHSLTLGSSLDRGIASCNSMNGSNLAHELIARQINEELLKRATEPGGPSFAVFSGDATDRAGGGPSSAAVRGGSTASARTPLTADFNHRRWVELVADPLADAGLPIFGAIGGQDLALDSDACPGTSGFQTGGCLTTRQAGVGAGANLPWRTTMARMPAPWERAAQANEAGFSRRGGGPLSQELPEQSTPEAALPPSLPSTQTLPSGLSFLASVRVGSVSTGGAATHYAFDALRDGEKVARIVVVDTSLRSLAASDPLQQPHEAGGQLRWLEEMLCFEGSPEDTGTPARDCTRAPGQQAIVVSNTPTYSYGPIAPEELQTDAAVFESVLLKNQANVVVSGRVGWNGRYWALAPGVHAPCPGEPYRPDSEAPSLGQPEICGAGAGEALDPSQATAQLPEQAREAAGLSARGALPFVVSSTAGGRFNLKAEGAGQATAEDGFWHGYSIVRLDRSGDPAKTIVEQRPILDWVGLRGPSHSVEPRHGLRLLSFAREPFGLDTFPSYFEIPETQAITHRYDLLLADPEEPWVPCEAPDPSCQSLQTKLAGGSRSLDSARDDIGGAGDDARGCDPYLCLPERVGAVDATTGEVKAGNGKYPDSFAIAMLSVGEHVATYPLVFKRSPSFVVNPAVALPSIPNPPAGTGTAPAPPAPPNPAQPTPPQPSAPNVPAPPPVPPIAASEPPEPQPPAPPAPPPPSEAPAPISLTLAPPSIAIATPTAVIQPPTPPVNPAPPGGARREARQRQAAAQKSGADGEQEAREQGVDLVGGPKAPEGAAFTRHDRTRPEPSITALTRADQPSAWPQALLYTGGLTMLAAALAAGWSRGRPTPRQRPPEVPAPAWSPARRRR